MKRKFILTLLLLLLPAYAGAAPIPNWPKFYESFEARPVDVELNDGVGGPLMSCAGHWASTATHIVRDDITPRYGTQYLHIQNVWSDTELCTGGGYGNYGFMRGYVMLRGDELDDGALFKINDGTEYWIGWSQYILPDEKVQIGITGAFQIMGNDNALAFIHTWGSEADVLAAHIFYDGGKAKNQSDFGSWIDQKGQWIDWVIQARFYTSDNANARFKFYMNGNIVLGSDWDGKENLNGNVAPYAVWQLYNTWACGWDPDATSCDDVKKAYYGCDNTGEWKNWTRNYILDEIRVNEYETGQGAHYCDVAPPIWAAKPTITVPAIDATGIAETFTAEFSGYSDHRSDVQACFEPYRMNVEVDEDGGNWGSLVYDSGDVSSASAHVISGLSVGTNYQIRVRHSSYSAARSTEYWGEWSDTVTFTTTSDDVVTRPKNLGIKTMNKIPQH